jgi:hypothetical protein
MNTQKIKDIKLGNESEKEMKPLIENHFGILLHMTQPHYEFDYFNDTKKILIELKTRNCKKNKYYDTMIGYNKIVKANEMIKLGYNIYFVFKFTDQNCIFQLHSNSNLIVKNGGRVDRGSREIKKYAYIPTNKLKILNDTTYDIIFNDCVFNTSTLKWKSNE